MVQFYRIIGTVVPLYYRFIRLLWVGPSVQPLLITVFLEEKENELYSGTRIELESACSGIPTQVVWGFLETGRESRPRPLCCQCTSEVQTLPLVLLWNTVQMFAFSQHSLSRTLGTPYFSFRTKNCLFPLGVWEQWGKPLLVQSFVMSTTARKRKSL